MRKILLMICVLTLLTACQTFENALLKEEWPKPQACNSLFDQDGEGSRKVKSCPTQDAGVMLEAFNDAKADALKQANFRCPNKCPAEALKMKRNNNSCKSNIYTAYVMQNFKCKPK